MRTIGEMLVLPRRYVLVYNISWDFNDDMDYRLFTGMFLRAKNI